MDKARIEWLAPLIVAALTFLTFLPVLSNDFIEIDDDQGLLDNLNWRGFTWTTIRWMFAQHQDYYRPLAWLSHALDYCLWGMNPAGHHLTSLLIHIANAVLFYFLCRRLLVLALPIPNDNTKLTLSAAFAALLFAIHPLRVESVAWVSERKDVLAGLFFLVAVYCYLRAWVNTTLVVYLLSLLSKPTGIMLPVALIILDIYLLKRLKPDPREWFSQRQFFLEKLPFILVAVPCVLISWSGETQNVSSASQHTVGVKLLNALYGPSRYLWQNLAPINLSPIYAIPPEPMGDPWIILGGLATILLTGLFFVLRNRWPWICWLWMITILTPALGFIQFGGSTVMLIGDRFTYLSCLGWATLAGGVLFGFLRVSTQTRREKRRGEVQRPFALRAITAAVIILGVLAPLTWRHAQVWGTTETFWRQVLKQEPDMLLAHHNLASFLQRQGNHTEAIAHYEKALNARPAHSDMAFLQEVQGHLGLAISQATIGKTEEAEAHYQQSLQLYRKAQADNPRIVRLLPQNYYQHLAAYFHAALGKALARQGNAKEAEAHFRRAIELNPNLPFCTINFC